MNKGSPTVSDVRFNGICVGVTTIYVGSRVPGIHMRIF